MIERRLVTKALAASLVISTERPGDVMVGPTDGASMADLAPYWLLEPLAGAYFETSFADSWNDVEFPYQVTSVGRNYEQCEALADRVRKGWLNKAEFPITIAGYSIMARVPDGGPNEPEKAEPDWWSITEGFRIRVTTS